MERSRGTPALRPRGSPASYLEGPGGTGQVEGGEGKCRGLEGPGGTGQPGWRVPRVGKQSAAGRRGRGAGRWVGMGTPPGWLVQPLASC